MNKPSWTSKYPGKYSRRRWAETNQIPSELYTYKSEGKWHWKIFYINNTLQRRQRSSEDSRTKTVIRECRQTEYTAIHCGKRITTENGENLKMLVLFSEKIWILKKRTSLSTIAMNKLNEIWLRNDKVKLLQKVHLHRSLVKSVLTYNCGTWVYSKLKPPN